MHWHHIVASKNGRRCLLVIMTLVFEYKTQNHILENKKCTIYKNIVKKTFFQCVTGLFVTAQ